MTAPKYTPIATILSKRGQMLSVSAVNGDVPSVALELRKGADPFAKPCAKIVLGIDTLRMVMVAMVNAAGVAVIDDEGDQADG